MAKGQNKSNREVRKPKQDKPAKTAAVSTSSLLSGNAKPAKGKGK